MNWKKIGDYCLLGLGFAAINTGGIVMFSYMNIPSLKVQAIISDIDKTPLTKPEKDLLIEKIKNLEINLWSDISTKEKAFMISGTALGLLGTVALSFKLIGSKIEDKKDLARHIRKVKFDKDGII